MSKFLSVQILLPLPLNDRHDLQETLDTTEGIIDFNVKEGWGGWL